MTKSLSKNISSGYEEIDECEKTKEMRKKIIQQYNFNAMWRFHEEFCHLRIRGPKKHEERIRTWFTDFELFTLRIKKTNSISEIIDVE